MDRLKHLMPPPLITDKSVFNRPQIIQLLQLVGYEFVDLAVECVENGFSLLIIANSIFVFIQVNIQFITY